jgi:site-specific DNA-adenine methylase
VPFAYYGSKHGLSRYYPKPWGGVIIEPFAGAAGYSCRWATPHDKVILTDAAPEVIALWHELRDGGIPFLDHLESQLVPGERVTHPILSMIAGGTVGRMKGTVQTKVTGYVIDHWPAIRRRMERVLPLMQNWDITCDTYDSIPNQRGTWFIDPPYQQRDGHRAGSRYLLKHNTIDYEALADWCRSRKGQVIVCEQGTADWLPFRPLRRQRANQQKGTATTSQVRMELMWARTPGGI